MTAKIQQQFADAIFTKLTPAPEHPFYNYKGFEPGLTVLKAGHVRSAGHRAFPTDAIFDRDTAIVLRDGVKLYADIFRPTDSDTIKVPAILPWSPYGKTGTGPQNYDFMAPFRAGIQKDRTSGYEKFEAPDPAEWVERGYAIVNIDARGAGHSEGDIHHWGIQEAEDVYDVIQWLAAQTWCNGSVAMAGNSWLSISQLNFASRLSHPALKAIAPWEAYTDLYRDFVGRGGKPHIPGFHKMIAGGFAGPGSVENVFGMFEKRPFYDDYWEAKRIPVENIDNIPIYLLGSYSSMLHTHGSFHTFQVAKTKQKWLRVHPYQEWYDIYRPEINDDLQAYFDHFCKGVENDWEKTTPPLRLSLLGFEADGSPAQTVLERPETAYPLEREVMREYFLDNSKKTMSLSPIDTEVSASYEGRNLDDTLDFVVHFDEVTELAGYSKVKLFMSCAEHDDMDIVVQIRKVSSDGRLLQHLNYPCPVAIGEVPDLNTAKTLGPQGFLRASHAGTLDSLASVGNDLIYKHNTRKPVTPGSIVELNIPLWPIGMTFAKGEGIMLRVSGHDMCLPETEMCRLTEPEDCNVGRHILHTGGQYPSALIVPVIS